MKSVISTFGDIIRINFGISKCYLVPLKQGGLLMIDTGFAGDYKTFIQSLDELKINPGDIKYLFLTHAHDDHVGFAEKIRRNSGCRLIVHEKSIPFLKSGKMPHMGMKAATPFVAFWGIVFSIFTIRKFKFSPLLTKDDDLICKTNQTLDIKEIGLDAKIIETPGHTDDSISLILSKGAVFCGDAAMNFLQFAGADYRPIYYYHWEKVLQSWQRIYDNGGRIVYPTHGEPFKIDILIERIVKYKERSSNKSRIF